jgi:hypothetical protein
VANSTEKWIERKTGEHAELIEALQSAVAALEARIDALEKKEKKPK